ncbi:MAG: FAD-dependent monooxygenase [Burkholderiales bacterium]|nr:FAD-dependent monooxygenase [Burkholderiales bacterium]
MIHKSIIIIGGGPVGMSLALLLSEQGKNVTILDQGLSKNNDGRILALSYASFDIIGKWLNHKSSQIRTPINTVQISHNGLGVSQIKAEALNLDSLGFTIKYSDVCEQLLAEVRSRSNIQLVIADVTRAVDGNGYAYVEYQDGINKHLLTCDLLIMAEGGKLLQNIAKKINHDYEEQAVIFHIKTKEKHNNIAYERFAKNGPLVLLPYNKHYVVVWSLKNELASQVVYDEKYLTEMLDKEFTNRLGGATIIDKPISFPLKLVQTKQKFFKRMVVVGNSAQTVHPVSAQGLNLGLRDVMALADLLSNDKEINLKNLVNYDSLRNMDSNAVIGFTHLLATKLESQNFMMKHLRGAGLIGLSNLPVLQNFIARSLIFGV